jgi:hypothetical protein
MGKNRESKSRVIDRQVVFPIPQQRFLPEATKQRRSTKGKQSTSEQHIRTEGIQNLRAGCFASVVDPVRVMDLRSDCFSTCFNGLLSRPGTALLVSCN